SATSCRARAENHGREANRPRRGHIRATGRQRPRRSPAQTSPAVTIMAQQHGEFGFLTLGLVLLAAAVLSVPIARRIGLSAIVAYLIAGVIIGPFGLAVFGTPESILPVSELGVVMLLFLIGLELELSRLMAMR